MGRKKGIGWHVDTIYRGNGGLRHDIQSLYAILGGTDAESVRRGEGTFVHNIVLPDGTRVWIYRAENCAENWMASL